MKKFCVISLLINKAIWIFLHKQTLKAFIQVKNNFTVNVIWVSITSLPKILPNFLLNKTILQLFAKYSRAKFKYIFFKSSYKHSKKLSYGKHYLNLVYCVISFMLILIKDPSTEVISDPFQNLIFLLRMKIRMLLSHVTFEKTKHVLRRSFY